MSDLITWLRAQLDEDERVAQAATPGPWEVDSEDYAETVVGPSFGQEVVSGSRWGGEGSVFNETEDAIHIARHDPARVLAEVDAKRRIIDDCEDRRSIQAYRLLKLLALPYADRPGYRAEWRL